MNTYYKLNIVPELQLHPPPSPPKFVPWPSEANLNFSLFTSTVSYFRDKGIDKLFLHSARRDGSLDFN